MSNTAETLQMLERLSQKLEATKIKAKEKPLELTGVDDSILSVGEQGLVLAEMNMLERGIPIPSPTKNRTLL